MKKVVGGYIAVICLIVLTFLGIKQYFFSIGYTQPLYTGENGVSYIARVNGTSFYVLDGEGQWQKSFLTGVDLGAGVPGFYPGDLAISEDDYFEWFAQIADMGSNVIRVYVPQMPGFYKALYEYNRAAATPLYLIQGVYMDETDVKQYGDVFAEGSSVVRLMDQDIVDCVNMIHGNAVIGAATGKAYGVYQYDVSKYVIGWILGIECESYLVNGTNEAHPDITSFAGDYVYTENASAFEVFIARAEELAISYETEHYAMQRPVAFCNWVTTDPLTHANEPLESEDSAVIDAEHIKARSSFAPGFFASYHVYPYYPDFLSYPSGDAQTDADPYLSYLEDLTAYHSMPVLVSEFGLPTSRGVTHINHLTGLNQGGNTEEQQGEGLALLLDDIHRTGCMGGIVFSWQDEWFKTSWNTTDLDDPSARAAWLDVESSEQNFGILSFDSSDSVKIDGDGSDWTRDDIVTADGVSVRSDEAYLYLRLAVDDFENGTYYIPIDTISGEGSDHYKDAGFDRAADFVLVVDGKTGTKLLVDPYYNANYKLYEDKNIFPAEEISLFHTSDSGIFEVASQVVSRALSMPATGEEYAPQVYETGLLRYGNSNPASPDYDSLADFCAGDGFVEVRIPWLLLNFADPSTGEILSDLHAGDEITYERITQLYLGLGKAGEGKIGMSPWSIKGWTAPTVTQRLKESYQILRDAFAKYATYAANMTGDLARALKARDVRLLYIRLDKQMDRTALVVYLLIAASTLVVYLLILLFAVNLGLERRQRKNSREMERLRALQKLEPEEIGPVLNLKFLRSWQGMNTLYELLTELENWNRQKNMVQALCDVHYPDWMRKKLASCGLWHAIQLVKLAGMMHLRYFEDDIVRLMEKYRGNLDMQYIGFLALSMMGNRDTIVRLCGKPGYTELLSFRCLKEIFVEYTGDKRFLYSKLLCSDDAYIRRICVKGIGDEGFTEFDDELIPMLEDGDANLRCDVIRSLGQLRCRKAGEKIAGFTESGNWTLRNAAYQALAAIDGARYADLIENGLRDPEWWVRYNSAMELSAIEGPAALRLRRSKQKDRFAIDILAFAIGEAELKAEEAALT